jgi:hypothetical protein
MEKTRTRTRHLRRAVLLAATLAGGVVGGAITAGSGGTGPNVVATADGPAQVAGLDKLLDAFNTGSAAGPGVVGGVVATVVGSQAFPPPADQVQLAIITGYNELGAQIKTNGQAGVAAMRDALAPLACANPAINAGLEAFAEAFDGFAAMGAPVAPFDLTAAEAAVLIRSLQAPEIAC